MAPAAAIRVLNLDEDTAAATLESVHLLKEQEDEEESRMRDQSLLLKALQLKYKLLQV